MKYRIFDWAGNLMNFGEFESIDDAHDYLVQKFEHLSDEELEVELGEYYFDEVKV